MIQHTTEQTDARAETNRRKRRWLERCWAEVFNGVETYATTAESRNRWLTRLANLQSELADEIERGIF